MYVCMYIYTLVTNTHRNTHTHKHTHTQTDAYAYAYADADRPAARMAFIAALLAPPTRTPRSACSNRMRCVSA